MSDKTENMLSKRSANTMKKFYAVFFFLVVFSTAAFAQDTLRVLFLGNSYCSVNNLPSLVQSLSNAAGKTLIMDSSMPGGMTISGHVNDPTSTAKINLGTWDYIVVQEQSQVPTIPYYRYNDMYPALSDLKMMAEQANPCVKIITYMTWGRRFGGQQCDPGGVNCSPVFVDFNHMQDSLTSAYMEISDLLSVQCAPVGVTWKNVLNDTTLVLHSSDNSHPNIDGSYLAACSIFSSIWKVPASGNAYTAGISSPRAQYYQFKSDATLFAGINDWNLFINEPTAAFSFSTSGNGATFSNTSSLPTGANGQLSYAWDFGDGGTSNLENPVHIYNSSGTYTVRLIASNCAFSDTLTQIVQLGATGLSEVSLSSSRIYPNPANGQLRMQTPLEWVGGSYQLFDASGRLVLVGTLVSENQLIEVGSLPEGIYHLRVAEREHHTLRLVSR